MTKTITIRNIKHLENLKFEIPETPGVYVLTGSNGSGKTTLMTCLLRIGWYRAFQDNFKVGNERIDSYKGEVIYTVGANSVSYRHAGTRWSPTPKRNRSLFNQFGFPEVRFLPATGNRLFIQEQNINPSDFRAVDAQLKSDLNSLLETNKFDNLRYVQTASTRGPGGGSQRWKRAYVIRTGNTYYSEKNFSLGEVLILNTLLLIQDVTDGSLLLIDELEMALHPRVQVRLLNYLKEKATEKRLTIILSTHSSSLIKAAPNLTYLENKTGDGRIIVHKNCYPALVLKDIAIEEDIQPDYVFLVEDDMAETLLKESIKRYAQLQPDRLIPIYKVIPIGGYPQVLDFAENASNYLFHQKIGIYLFPDFDVIDVKDKLRKAGNSRDATSQQRFEQFRRLENVTRPLPITPELGVWNWIITETADVQQSLNSYYSDVTFNLRDLVDATNRHYPTSAENERTAAKRKLKYIVKLMEERTNENSKRINQFLFGLFVKSYYSGEKSTAILKQTFGQIFGRRGNT